MSGEANSILVEPADGQRRIRERGTSESDILPGMLLQRSAAGVFEKHSTAAGNAQKLFALSNLADAKGIDDVWPISNRVRGLYAQPGDLINAVLGASAAAIQTGDFLESDGNGYLRVVVTAIATTDAERSSIIAVAGEAVDNSAGPAGTRILVEVV
jgi:hypothetical protein